MLTFIPVTPASCALVMNLATEIWHECYHGILTTDQIAYMLARMYAPAVIAGELHQGIVWELVRLGEVPVGFLAYRHDSGPLVKLAKLYLLAAYRGRGFSAMMVERVVGYARVRGCHGLTLNVNVHNLRAKRAYAKLGFSKTGAEVIDIGNGFVMDDEIMTRMLPG